MTDRLDVTSAPAAHEPYSPQRRTALVLTGTGTAGAYHAGVLRALHEAGVKLDVVAGRGIGVVGALFTAIDGGQRLWDEKGFWHGASVRRLYSWHPMPRLAAISLMFALGAVLVPAAFVPDSLPTWLPRLALLILVGAVFLLLAAGLGRHRLRRVRGPIWWEMFP